ncbi:MAG: glycosyl hydrolase family 18 protein [Firmicutes bacterium]|nr:glycosyl hydrolase family 18 protein [Bacillota bacterium]
MSRKRGGNVSRSRRFGAVVLLTLVSALTASPAAVAASQLQVIGFWASDASAGLAGLYQYPRSITYFTPFWYSVNAMGGLVNHVNTAILDKVNSLHIPITPLVNDATGTQAFLRNPLTRLNAARNIADMVKGQHYAGVDIDFEPTHTSLAPELSAFAIDLRDFLPRRAVVSMAIVPNSGGAYQWNKLIPEVNQFVLMSYDEHDDGSYAGPVAATPWVQNILTRMERVVPANKIDLGIAVYGYIWPLGSTVATTVPYNAVTPQMNEHAKWDTEDQETYATFDTASGPVIAWWESLQGMNQKIQLAKEDHLHGVALWHLGYANKSVYQLLLHQIGSQPT